jgi:hypothetical protein
LLDLSTSLLHVEEVEKKIVATMVVEAATSLGHHAFTGVGGGRYMTVLKEIVIVAIVIPARSKASS